jgi:hypothetical protein
MFAITNRRVRDARSALLRPTGKKQKDAVVAEGRYGDHLSRPDSLHRNEAALVVGDE